MPICSNSIANTLELPQFSTMPSIYSCTTGDGIILFSMEFDANWISSKTIEKRSKPMTIHISSWPMLGQVRNLDWETDLMKDQMDGMLYAVCHMPGG